MAYAVENPYYVPNFERFMSKVNMNGHTASIQLGPCWSWTGNLDEFGYGRFKLDQKSYQAHRWMMGFLSETGPLVWEKGNRQTVNHRCGRRDCVKPSHLYVGTQKENVGDAIADGTHTSTVKAGFQKAGIKLKAEQVLEIRASVDRVAVLAERFGISKQTVYMIKKRGTWPHL